MVLASSSRPRATVAYSMSYGGTNATSGVLPELKRATYDAVKAGDLGFAMKY